MAINKRPNTDFERGYARALLDVEKVLTGCMPVPDWVVTAIIQTVGKM